MHRQAVGLSLRVNGSAQLEHPGGIELEIGSCRAYLVLSLVNLFGSILGSLLSSMYGRANTLLTSPFAAQECRRGLDKPILQVAEDGTVSAVRNHP